MSIFDWKNISEDEKSRLQANFSEKSLVTDLVRYENGFVMPRLFAEKIQKRIFDFELRDDDIWIVTFPKCGTTWTQELVWMLVNDLDMEAGREPLTVRSVFLEGQCVVNYDFFKSMGIIPENKRYRDSLKDQISFTDKMDKTKRRVIKSHLPLEFLPPQLLDKCKVVYVARNPKDCAVSFYHHNKLLPGHGYTGSFEEFMQFFVEGLQVFGDYWHHIFSFWKKRNHENVKFVWFEDMKKNQKLVIEQLCDFLHHPLSDEKIDALVNHVKFENMRKNPATNPTAKLTGDEPDDKNFMRKGQVGDWKNYFDPEKNKEWNAWIARNISGTDMEQLDHFQISNL